MATSDQLGSVLQTLICLLENFEQSSSLSWTQATDELYQICRVWEVDCPVNVNTDFICPVDEFELKAFQQFFL